MRPTSSPVTVSSRPESAVASVTTTVSSSVTCRSAGRVASLGTSSTGSPSGCRSASNRASAVPWPSSVARRAATPPPGRAASRVTVPAGTSAVAVSSTVAVSKASSCRSAAVTKRVLPSGERAAATTSGAAPSETVIGPSTSSSVPPAEPVPTTSGTSPGVTSTSPPETTGVTSPARGSPSRTRRSTSTPPSPVSSRTTAPAVGRAASDDVRASLPTASSRSSVPSTSPKETSGAGSSAVAVHPATQTPTASRTTVLRMAPPLVRRRLRWCLRSAGRARRRQHPGSPAMGENDLREGGIGGDRLRRRPLRVCRRDDHSLGDEVFQGRHRVSVRSFAASPVQPRGTRTTRSSASPAR